LRISKADWQKSNPELFPAHNLPLKNRIQTRMVGRPFLAPGFGEAANGKCLLTEVGDSAILWVINRKNFNARSVQEA
jgi:hypothetical protein